RVLPVGAVAAGGLVVAYAAASADPLLLAGVLGVAVLLPLVLRAPAVTLLLWIATGATMGGWLAVQPGGLPAVSVDRALLAALIGVCAVRWIRHPGLMLGPGPIEWRMLLFLAVALVSNLLAGPTMEANGTTGRHLDLIFLGQSYLVPFVGFFLAKNLLDQRKHLHLLLVILVVVGCLVGLVGILQQLTGFAMFRPTRYEVIHEARATGTLSSAAHFGLVMTLCLFPAIVLLRRARTLAARFALIGAVSLILVSLVLCKTRAAYLGVLVGFAILGSLDRRLGRILVIVVLFASLALLLAWPFVAESDFVAGRLSDATPILNRIALTGTAVNMIVHRPVFGFGFGRYRFAEERGPYLSSLGGVSREWAYSLHVPHNEYLHLLVLTGVVGFLPYLAAMVGCFRTAVRAYREYLPRNGIERDVALAAMLGFVAYLLNGLFSELLFAWYASNIVFVLLGAVEGIRERAARAAAPASPRAGGDALWKAGT
ncbi:O-antigen ligase family protein, partial [bacterium]|nr:O-antigen ligase family protein [bacterium]